MKEVQKKTLHHFITQYQLVEAKEFDHMFVGIAPNDIVYMQFKPDTSMDIDCAKSVVAYVGELTNKKAVYNIIELATGSTINKEASLYSKSEEANKYTIADAVIVKNNVHKILGNMYINFGPACRPTKLFTTIEDAQKWFEQFKHKKS